MAASAWRIYNEAKKYLLTSDIDLNGTIIRVKLLAGTKSAAVSNYTRSTFASLTHITGNLGVAIKSLPGLIVTAGASAKEIKFDSTAFIFTASAGNVTSVQYAVIGVSGGKCLAWCKLSTAVFTVTVGNTLTITPHASGIFTLTGGTT
jgi:hypothetical protein